MKKLIFVDIDGTLLRDDGTFNLELKDIIKEHLTYDNYIVLTSARPRDKVRNILNNLDIDGYYISSNGAEIYNHNMNIPLYIEGISRCSMLYIYNLAIKHKIDLIFAVDDGEYILDHNNIKNNFFINIIKNKTIKQCMLLSNDLNSIEKFKEKIDFLDNIKFTCSKATKENNRYWYSIVNNNVSKGNACDILSKITNTNNLYNVAIGNDYNDISMFEKVKNSVAVNNSDNCIKNMAKEIIESNNDDGVYKYLQKLLEKEEKILYTK